MFGYTIWPRPDSVKKNGNESLLWLVLMLSITTQTIVIYFRLTLEPTTKSLWYSVMDHLQTFRKVTLESTIGSVTG